MITLTKNGRERERKRERGRLKQEFFGVFFNILLYGFTIIPKNLTVRFKDLP